MDSRADLRVVVLLLLFGVTVSNLTLKNVIFERRNVISTTRASWKLTLIENLQPYVNLFQTLYQTLDGIDDSLDTALGDSGALKLHDPSDRPGLLLNFLRLNVEIKDLSDTLNEVRDNFLENMALKNKRSKRSLLPFVGDTMSFLFGTLSGTDLSRIKSSIRELAYNQQKLKHIAAESITLINVTNVQVAENRQTVNQLLADVSKLDSKVLNITQTLENRILDLEEMVQVYLQIDLAIEEFKRSFSEFCDQIEHFHIKLNMLAIGKLTPSLITPARLQTLLLDIQTQLPHSLKLPGDIKAEIWHFYRILTCETHVDQDQLIIVISIPLLNTDYELEIYKIHNIPIPYQNNDTTAATLTAQYALKTDTIAVDKSKTRAVLLTPEETQICSNEHLGFCPIRSPIYSLGTSKACEIALFMRNDGKINEYCKIVISSSSVLPVANYLNNGLWIVTTHKEIRFSINCEEPKGSHEVTIAPPAGSLELSMTCMGHSEYVTLTPFYRKSSKTTLNFLLPTFLTNYNKTQTNLWSPVKRKFPKFDPLKLPNPLRSVHHIPMEHFLNELDKVQALQDDYAFPYWTYAIGLSIMLFTVTGVVVLLFRKKLCNKPKVTESFNGDDLELAPLGNVKHAGCDEASGDREDPVLLGDKVQADISHNPVRSGDLYPDLRTVQ